MYSEACLFPGSFDPVTKGHLDIIQRAARIFKKVYVGVLINPDKKGLFTPEERAEMIRCETKHIEGVQVVIFSGLTVELMKQLGVSVAVRGVRGAADLEIETAMAHINRSLYPGMETLFLPADGELCDVSSSYVKQIAFFGGDVSRFVPVSVLEAVNRKYNITITSGGKNNG